MYNNDLLLLWEFLPVVIVVVVVVVVRPLAGEVPTYVSSRPDDHKCYA